MTGQTITHYRIQEKLGEGGMGVVYRAFDTHLQRAVAIKVLRGEAVANPERKKRFVREARAASALNHPNIVTIYDIDSAPLSGEAQGQPVDFIAMEYVEGKTLDQLAGRKPMPLANTLHYAVQLAGALAAAHDAGIVHRDLKPGNVIVTEKGLLKVLDFGLAKLTERAEGDQLAPTQSMNLEEAPHTEEGMIVGTVAYMSPEQAQGKTVDARSDIFSFGSVLYEMLTGRRAFHGETKVALLSAVLAQEPRPASQIVEGVPAELERIVNRCLRKDPERRFQHMQDLKVALQELQEESDSGRLEAAPAAVPKKARRGLAVGIAAAIALAAAAATVAWWLARSRTAPSDRALVRLTSDSGLSYMPALSADGKLLAYASDRSGEGNLDIWVKQVAGGEPARLTRDPAPDLEPAFSPDGTRIAFRSEREGRGIYVVSALGGDERRVADLGYQPRWSPDGQWISYGVNTPASNLIYAVPSTGGASRQLLPEMYNARPPVWSSDGKHILFYGRLKANEPDWWVAPFEGGRAVPTGAPALLRRHRLKTVFYFPFGISVAGWPAAWSAEGDQVLFSAALGDSTNVWGLSISPRTGAVIGAPEQLTFGTGAELGPSTAPGGSSGQRLLAYANVASNTDVWSLPVDDKQGKVAGEPQRLTRDAAADHSPFPSPDGQKVTFISRRSGNDRVWLKDLASGRETPITFAGAADAAPVFTRDGSKAAYLSDEYGKNEIYVVAIGPKGDPGPARRVCENCGRPTDWSVDGQKLLFSGRAGQRIRAALLDVASGQKAELLQSEENLANQRLSRDGRWVLFNETFAAGGGRLWIAPLNGPLPVPRPEWILVSEGRGFQLQPCWAPDESLVYVVSERDGFRCIWAQRLDPGNKRPRGTPFPVQHFHGSLSMMPIPDNREIGLHAARDKLFFSLVESTGNIWLARIGAR